MNTRSRRCIFAAPQHNHTHSHGHPKPARIGVPPPNRLLFQDRTFSLLLKDPVPDENPRRVQARGGLQRPHSGQAGRFRRGHRRRQAVPQPLR
ncbi:hypothetical protein SMJ63A_180046 [Stenotrophomonas geniculata]